MMTIPVNTAWMSLADGDGANAYDGYLALPPAGRGPGLLLLQEIFGVNRHIRAVAEQYALDGFVVLAPDLFWRDAQRVDLGYDGADRERAYGLMKGLQPQAVAADVQAAVAALRRHPAVTGQVGAIGYCMGGRLAFSAAAQGGVDAAVAYYGGGIHTQLELASQIACPLQLHFAERDDHIPMSAVEQVRAAVAGLRAEVHVYPGALHGFNCWDRSAYHAASAALAHGRSLQFLAQLF